MARALFVLTFVIALNMVIGGLMAWSIQQDNTSVFTTGNGLTGEETLHSQQLAASGKSEQLQTTSYNAFSGSKFIGDALVNGLNPLSALEFDEGYLGMIIGYIITIIRGILAILFIGKLYSIIFNREPVI